MFKTYLKHVLNMFLNMYDAIRRTSDVDTVKTCHNVLHAAQAQPAQHTARRTQLGA